MQKLLLVKPYQMPFLLWVLFFYAFESRAQSTLNFYHLTKDACQTYLGDNPTHYISNLSHQYENPLASTALGQMVLKNSFNSSYDNYQYLNQDQFLAELIHSAEFSKALDECYEDKTLSKSYFLFFLNQLDIQAKTTSFTMDAASLAGGGFLLAKFSGLIIQRIAWTKSIFKWAGRSIMITFSAYISLTTGKIIYKAIKDYNAKTEKQSSHNKDVMNSYESAAQGSIQSIDEQIISLKAELKSMKSGSEKTDLLNLLHELETIDSNLRQQLGEIQKKLNSAS